MSRSPAAPGAYDDRQHAQARSRLGFVGIPLVWGVVETAIHALKLFH